jgi:hypothetical protein
MTAVHFWFSWKADSVIGAIRDATIEVDFTSLVEDNLITPESSPASWTVREATKYWVVRYALVSIAKGSSIRAEAHWPKEEDLHLFPGAVRRVVGAKRIGIAATFFPDTA